jgi:hypothetical protein
VSQLRIQRVYFHEPIAVWLFNGRPHQGMRLIRDVHDGLAALHRYGFETLKGSGRPFCHWGHTKSALLQALEDPRPEMVLEAREAVFHAAVRVGALAANNSFEILMLRGEPFAP